MEMPPSIPDTPENVLKSLFAGPPPKNWQYLDDYEAKKRAEEARRNGKKTPK